MVNDKFIYLNFLLPRNLRIPFLDTGILSAKENAQYDPNEWILKLED